MAKHTIVTLEAKLPRFTTPHKKGGSGPHRDKRYRRQRTRGAAIAAAMKDA